ncbi:hypothetical protein GCM10022291_18040 [Postechiella marina]|uniref:Lipoprotein n=1 Tax=Postechiella marina TaxID=943941 RepID=A0ABP8C8Q5_9FLAO
MKRLFILSFILVLFSACSTDDNYPNYDLEILPVESVDIPDEFELGEAYPITISYLKPTSCHQFSELYYVKSTNERTVAIIDYVFDGNDCETLENELVETTFNFIVNSNGSYIFKFWQGKNDQDEDQYLIIEVPVVEPNN